MEAAGLVRAASWAGVECTHGAMVSVRPNRSTPPVPGSSGQWSQPQPSARSRPGCPKVPPAPHLGHITDRGGETIALFIAEREPRNGLGFDAH